MDESDNLNTGSETEVNAADAFIDADVFYSEPDVPTETEEEEEIAEPKTGEAGEKEEGDKPNTVKYRYIDDSDEYEFKSNGQTVTANIDKLIENFSKGEGFTKKTTELADREKSRAKEHAAALETIKQQEKDLLALTDSIQGLLEEEQIDWEELRDSDPSAYLREKERIETRKTKLEEAKKKVSERQQSELKDLATNEFKQLKEVMGWDTHEKVTEGFGTISDYCLEIGMSADDIRNIYNHKIYQALSDAAKYRELESEKSKTVKEVKSAPKSVKSTTPAKSGKKKEPWEVIYGT